MLSWMMEFFFGVCFCLFFVAFAVAVSLVFISGQNFISGMKDVAASTAVVELIIKTTTLAIVYITHGNSIQLSIQH